MAKGTHVAVGKRTLELTNLTKILYPEDGISKAEVIQYYLSVAPTMLSHIKGSPLSLIRFPDGIHQEQFFQKNKPDWSPEWVESEPMGSEPKDYVVATEEASLVWLANLACLEIHQMQVRRPDLSRAHYFVFDLDPPEDYNFEELKSIAFDLKEHIEAYGYNTFVKTTGGKGLHIVVPVNAKYSIDEVFEAASEIAKPFVSRDKRTTLQLNKSARKGRVLIDIFRNRNSQTIICPYSLRGRVGAPVAMPVSWNELTAINSSTHFTLHDVPAILNEQGDAWEGIDAAATDIHTKADLSMQVRELPQNARHKTPKQLEEYEAKRDFNRTPEPEGLFEGGDGTGFVIHRHSASHLHYDLRLEQDGVLKSWAVPKGMPPMPGIKRLAVATEDHPMKYITFEAEIPKGQYGGGMMWIYANGKYEITKQKKDGFYFKLSSKGFSGEFRMHLMKEKEWLLERVDNPQHNYLDKPPAPMLATIAKKVPLRKYLYEMKWDGIRAIIVVNEGELKIYSRNLNDLTEQFPELSEGKSFRSISGVFDGEIVCVDKDGKPDFKTVIHRMHRKGEKEIAHSAKKYPAYCYLFDALQLDGKLLTRDPLVRRRAWLEDSVKKHTNYRISEVLDDGSALFEATGKMGLEGIMAKDAMSTYQPGRRSDSWLKVKHKQTEVFTIVGYTRGQGDRSSVFGALHISEKGKPGVYRGKVGTGFTEAQMKKLSGQLHELNLVDKPITEKLPDDKDSVWIEPVYTAEIQYTELTSNGTLRDPVFLKLRKV